MSLRKGMLINFINLTDEEMEMVRSWRNNENVRKWMHANHVISRKEHLDFIERLRGDSKNFYWLLKDRLGKYIGVIYLNKENLESNSAYLGIYKNPNYKSHGVGHLLMECLKKLTFDIALIPTLKLEGMNNNKHAVNFFKKQGFKKEAKREEFTIMSIRKEEKAGT